MATSAAGLLLFASVLLFAHLTYVAVGFKDELQLKEETFSSLPLEAILECVVALLLAVLGSVLYMQPFQLIKTTSNIPAVFDIVNNRSNFVTFNHRGKYLSQREAQ